MFEQLCKVIESFPVQLGEFESPLRSAAVFSMTHEIRRDLPFDEDELHIIENSFFLPFNSVVVDTSEVAVLLRNAPTATHGFPFEIETLGACRVPEGLLIDTGTVTLLRCVAVDDGQPSLEGQWKPGRMFIYDSRRLMIDEIPANAVLAMNYLAAVLNGQGTTSLASGTALYGVARTLDINRPHHFIMETSFTTSVKYRGSRIPRKNERPSYTTITPRTFRRMCVLGGVLSDSEERKGAHHCSHWRRKHFRTLRSERFVHKRGETIVIPSSWIGPSEVAQSWAGKRYRVLTDM